MQPGMKQTTFFTNGTETDRISIESYPGEWAIIDGSKKSDGRPYLFSEGNNVSPVQSNNNFTHNVAGWNPSVLSTNPLDDDFLSLSSSSSARDAGTDVGLPFLGSAPDIGALAYGKRITDLGLPAINTLTSVSAIRGVMSNRAGNFR